MTLPAYADPSLPTPADATPDPPPLPAGVNDVDGLDDPELRSWLACPPLFTIRKEPAPLLGRGGRSTAEAVALALALVSLSSSSSGVGGKEQQQQQRLRWRAAARAIRSVVQAANGLQLALMDPATVRHRTDRPGYVPNLYGWEQGGGGER